MGAQAKPHGLAQRWLAAKREARTIAPKMSNAPLEVRPFPAKPGHVLSLQGEILPVPAGWALLPPGDAALSRRIKADGPCWVVRQRKGRRMLSLGIWAPADRLAALRADLAVERADPAYTRKLEAGRTRRAREQAHYAEDFAGAVEAFLGFAPSHAALAGRLARAIAAHAVPVGSGTVARTRRIPLEERAEAAVIAWLRHQTTDYDQRTIVRRKGERRAVRRELAQESRRLLAGYRRGDPVPAEHCPLRRALDR